MSENIDHLPVNPEDQEKSEVNDSSANEPLQDNTSEETLEEASDSEPAPPNDAEPEPPLQEAGEESNEVDVDTVEIAHEKLTIDEESSDSMPVPEEPIESSPEPMPSIEDVAPSVESNDIVSEEAPSEPDEPVTEPEEVVSEDSTDEKSEEADILKHGESIDDESTGDEIDHEDPDSEAEEEEEEIHVEGFSKQELVAFVERVVKDDKILKQAKPVARARDRFNELFEAERKKALDEFLAIEGNVEMDFEFPLSYIDRQWRDAIRKFGIRKRALREAIVAERETNLKKKQALLEQLKELSERATDHDAFEKLKQIQDEWRNTGQVPVADLDSLNKNYRFLNDKFFDQRSLIREFQDYDRKKNLDAKKEIISSIEELAGTEENLKELLRHHRQLLDNWRDTGPVPRENLDDVMNAFRAANDKITEKKNALIEVLDGERKGNQTKKEAIIEKVLDLLDDENGLSWSKRNQKLGELINEWKSIGGVPRSENTRIRTEFTDAVKAFNKVKNTFFKEQKRQQAVNVELREGAIAKVRDIVAEGGDLSKRRNEVIQIQKYWKTLGHIPKKKSDELWNEFRSTCNSFFDSIKAGDVAKQQEQEENFKKKEEICVAIEKLSEQEDLNQEELDKLESSWREIGFVPLSKKRDIEDRYRKAVRNVLAQSIKMEDVPEHLTDYKLKIEGMVRDDSQKLNKELQGLRKRIQRQNEELNTLETNIQFFSNSKGADKLIAPILKQIDGIKNDIESLREKERLAKQSLDLLRK